jgi:hypothetical protein
VSLLVGLVAELGPRSASGLRPALLEVWGRRDRRVHVHLQEDLRCRKGVRLVRWAASLARRVQVLRVRSFGGGLLQFLIEIYYDLCEFVVYCYLLWLRGAFSGSHAI